MSEGCGCAHLTEQQSTVDDNDIVADLITDRTAQLLLVRLRQSLSLTQH